MTFPHPNPPAYASIRAARDWLLSIPAEGRLTAMQKLIIDQGGTWGLPNAGATRRPVLYEVTLHGVYASATAPDELPGIWCKCAQAILRADTGGEAA